MFGGYSIIMTWTAWVLLRIKVHKYIHTSIHWTYIINSIFFGCVLGCADPNNCSSQFSFRFLPMNPAEGIYSTGAPQRARARAHGARSTPKTCTTKLLRLGGLTTIHKKMSLSWTEKEGKNQSQQKTKQKETFLLASPCNTKQTLLFHCPSSQSLLPYPSPVIHTYIYSFIHFMQWVEINPFAIGWHQRLFWVRFNKPPTMYHPSAQHVFWYQPRHYQIPARLGTILRTDPYRLFLLPWPHTVW